MVATLEISDGTTTINLLQGVNSGFHLNSWQPAVAQAKTGGTFQASSLANGRNLVDRKFDNVIDNFDLKINNQSQNRLIREIQDCFRLLEKATQYWTTDWQNEPVWIKTQAKCEDNARYTLIVNYQWEELNNPYSQPFYTPFQISVMDDITLVIEHKHWTSTQPGTNTAIELSALEAYDGRNLGNVSASGTRQAITTRDVYFSNKRVVANLSDVYYYDASGPAFSANLMDAAVAFDLYPDPQAVGDILYLGIDTTLVDSGPFSNVIFDLENVAIGAGHQIAWEYYNGAWVALTVEDGTSDFQFVGINGVYWRQPSDWATVAINGVTGYWVRARITGITAGTPVPSQQNRSIYSSIWPYAEIQSDIILGDIASLANILIHNNSATISVGGNPETGFQVLTMGLRSMDRGENFTAYINLADEQNPTGIDCTASAPAGHKGVFETDTTAPSGRRLAYNPAGVDAMSTVGIVTIDETIAQEFYGSYHLFLRARQSGGASGQITLKVEINSFDDSLTTAAAPYFATDTEEFANTNIDQFFDFGLINLPGLPLLSGQIVEIIFKISAASTSATPSLHLYDLVLVPVDEWAGQFIDINNTDDTVMRRTTSNGTTGTPQDHYLQIDSITNPKLDIVALNVFESITTGNPITFSTYQPIAVQEIIFQANERQRLWFFSTRYEPTGTDDLISTQETINSIQAFKQDRWLVLRGES